ncbi:unnamed protein product [Gadus morhua 'NCC']
MISDSTAIIKGCTVDLVTLHPASLCRVCWSTEWVTFHIPTRSLNQPPYSGTHRGVCLGVWTPAQRGGNGTRDATMSREDDSLSVSHKE